MRALFIICSLFTLVGCAGSPLRANDSASATATRALDEVIAQDGGYHCEGMALAVNALRRLGKEESLQVLRQYLKANNGEHELTVVLVCRVLFAPPKGGWGVPSLGVPIISIAESETKRFPQFPIATCDGVPFLVEVGYMRDGVAVEGRHSIEKAADLQIISADLPTNGYNIAAQELTRGADFEALYSSEWARAYMSRQIGRQATQ